MPSVQALVFSHFVAPALDETWPGLDAAFPDLDRTLTECTDVSSMAEISSHICESFFLSPKSTLECEQPVKSIYWSLSMAVDDLLEMVQNSSRQVSVGPLGTRLASHSLLCGSILAPVLMLCLREGLWVKE